MRCPHGDHTKENEGDVSALGRVGLARLAMQLSVVHASLSNKSE